MTIRPGLSSESKILGGIVIHTISVLSANPILLPFYVMLTKPEALVVS